MKLKIFSQVSILIYFLVNTDSEGCGINYDKIRKRRVEALRGQILSKLGLTRLPNNNQETPPELVTREIEETFNRTRDYMLERARHSREYCVEHEKNYYAQDVITVNCSLPPENNSPGEEVIKRYRNMRMLNQNSNFLYFNTNSINSHPEQISSATMRLYEIPSRELQNVEQQQVSLYQLIPFKSGDNSPSKKILTTNTVDLNAEGWISFDITSAIQEWIRQPELNLGLELTVSCADNSIDLEPSIRPKSDDILRLKFAGPPSTYLHSRGDRADSSSYNEESEQLSDKAHPHVVLLVTTAKVQTNSFSNNAHRRHKRSLNADYCFGKNPSEPNCCLRELYIDFRRDLNWNWIWAPTGVNVNYCAGACPYMWSSDSQHSTILSLYRNLNPKASASPCCSPNELEPLTIMYFDDGKLRFIELTDVVLVSCKCN